MSRPAKPKPPSPASPIVTPVVGEIEPAPKVTRHIKPLGPRVLVRILKHPDRSEAGLFLPQGVKDSHAAALLAEVVEVARAKGRGETKTVETERDEDDDDDAHDFGTNVSGVPLGANVLFEKDRGIAVPWDDSLRLLEVRHVLAIVDIIDEDEIQ